MGRGSSKAGGGGSGGAKPANTPSGISYDQFMKMSEAQRFSTIQNIVADNSIQVPNYLDGSDTSKVIYALGINGKPAVVSDTALDAMPGKEVFRTVYEGSAMPPPTSADILDQIRNGDYTQLSGSGGSVHGRALYFATNFTGSTAYGSRGRNALVSRGKINPNAKIIKESTLDAQIRNKNVRLSSSWEDNMGLYALSQGIDGWYDGSYTMVVNRSNITMSSQNKSIKKALKSGKPSARQGAVSWKTAANMP